MVKMIFGWRDRPGMTAQDCEAHYRAVHMNLARAALDGVDGFQGLVYNRVRSHQVNDFNQPQAHPEKPDLDAILELYFRDQDSLQAAFGTPALTAMFDDHVNFMDTESPANIRIYTVDETVFFGSRP
jgi:uncharacterized protein (TIGR02118 family)